MIEDERGAGADAFPLFVERGRGLVLGPRLEVGGGEVLEVVRAAPELAGVVPAIIEIEHMVTPLVK